MFNILGWLVNVQNIHISTLSLDHSVYRNISDRGQVLATCENVIVAK